MEDRFLKRLGNKAKKGFRGWPMATVAFYGPDLSYASTRFIDGGSARQRRWELVCHFIMSRDSAAAPTSTSGLPTWPAPISSIQVMLYCGQSKSGIHR